MSARSHEEIMFEAEYWKTISNDLGEMLQVILDCSHDLVQSPVGVTELMTLYFRLSPSIEQIDAWQEVTGRMHGSNASALSRLENLIDRISSAVDITNGRFAALSAEAKPQQEGDPS